MIAARGPRCERAGVVTATANAAARGARGDSRERAVDGHQASIDHRSVRFRPTERYSSRRFEKRVSGAPLWRYPGPAALSERPSSRSVFCVKPTAASGDSAPTRAAPRVGALTRVQPRARELAADAGQLHRIGRRRQRRGLARRVGARRQRGWCPTPEATRRPPKQIICRQNRVAVRPSRGGPSRMEGWPDAQGATPRRGWPFAHDGWSAAVSRPTPAEGGRLRTGGWSAAVSRPTPAEGGRLRTGGWSAAVSRPTPAEGGRLRTGGWSAAVSRPTPAEGGRPRTMKARRNDAGSSHVRRRKTGAVARRVVAAIPSHEGWPFAHDGWSAAVPRRRALAGWPFPHDGDHQRGGRLRTPEPRVALCAQEGGRLRTMAQRAPIPSARIRTLR